MYESTIHVVKAITALTHDVKEGQIHNYLDHVKKVGLELRDLLATVDALISTIPPSSHREVSSAKVAQHLIDRFLMFLSNTEMRGT